MAGPPNVIYLHSHDTGRWIEPYGFAVPTPNLRRLAEEGMLFRQAFCANPTCSPSRAALLTGQWAHSAGSLGLAHRGFGLKDCSRHLAQTLKAAGYSTFLSGIQHEVAREDLALLGYQAIIGEPGNADAKAAEFLRGKPPRPFFLSVGFFQTHREFPPAPFAPKAGNLRPPPPLPDHPVARGDFAGFVAAAQALDARIGNVLAALEHAGLADDTLVICTTDHGPAFPFFKCNLTDGGTGVFLILRGPGGFAGGKVCDALVSQIDVFPTVCDVIGIPKPAWLQGHSLAPLAAGTAQEVRGELFSEVNYHAAYEPMRAVRTRRWKYIVRYDGRARPVLPNCDDSPTKDLYLELGWGRRAPDREALYDLFCDPCETTNLAGGPAHQGALKDQHVLEHQGVLNEMREKLQAWMRATDDPLLRGPVPAPEGALVNDPDGLSPKEPTQPARR
jgi:arylsulfatase A-like enzyme